MAEESRFDRIRWLLTLLALGLLASGLYAILAPFIRPFAWALITALACWPVYRRFCAFLPSYPGAAAFMMTCAIFALFALAVIPVVVSLMNETDVIAGRLNKWVGTAPEQLAGRLHGVVVLGTDIGEVLHRLELTDEALVRGLAEYQRQAVTAATAALKGVVSGVFRLIITFISLYFLFRHGKTAAAQLRRGVSKIGGLRFSVLLTRIKETIRAAVYGILATALAQGALAAVGYLLAGAPVPIFLGFLTMLSSLVPVGTPIVFVPVTAYLFWSDRPGAALFMIIWGTVVVGLTDNLLRPLFISQSIRMPLVLSLFAVLGGVIAFGVIGIVLGPTIVAVAQAIWLEWIDEERIEDSLAQVQEAQG